MIITRVSASGFGASEYDPEKMDLNIHAIEKILESLPENLKIDCKSNTKHHFTPGIYCRELFMPAGSVLTGRYHRQQDILIIAQGTCHFLTKHGLRTLSAPAVTKVEPGTKPFILCATDVTFVNALPNPDNCEDIDELERRWTLPQKSLPENEKAQILGGSV